VLDGDVRDGVAENRLAREVVDEVLVACERKYALPSARSMYDSEMKCRREEGLERIESRAEGGGPSARSQRWTRKKRRTDVASLRSAGAQDRQEILMERAIRAGRDNRRRTTKSSPGLVCRMVVSGTRESEQPT